MQRGHRVLPGKGHLSPACRAVLRVPSAGAGWPTAPQGWGTQPRVGVHSPAGSQLGELPERGGRGDTSWESHTPLPPFSPPSPKGHYFCQKHFAHLFNSSWSGKSLWAGLEDKTSSDSPGHVRSKLPPARTPPPRSPGPARQAPSHPPFTPSPRSRCFGIVSPPNTHRCRNLENFHATKVLFPEWGCKFLLSWGRADAQPGCTGPPGQPVPNPRGNAGKSPVRSEPAQRGCGGSVPTDTTVKGAQPKPSGRLQPPLLHRPALTDPAGTDFYPHEAKGTGCFYPTRRDGCRDSGDGDRLATRGGWQAAVHGLRSPRSEPHPLGGCLPPSRRSGPHGTA